MAEDRGRCLEAGMDDYVSKPIRPEDLFGVLEKLISSPRGAKADSGKGEEIET